MINPNYFMINPKIIIAELSFPAYIERSINNFGGTIYMVKISGKTDNTSEKAAVDTNYSTIPMLDVASGKFEIPENNPDDPTKGENALWRAVITQALMDAGSHSQKNNMRLERAQAISWISGTSTDFYDVCAMADMNPDYVKRKSKEAIKRECKWRKVGGKKKAKQTIISKNLHKKDNAIRIMMPKEMNLRQQA